MKRYLKIKIANNLFTRFKGFMFEKNIDYSIYFPKCNAIHTFFVKENIDIIVLNSSNKILKIIRNISKNKIIKVKYNIKDIGILEIPTKLFFTCKLGDTIIFK